MFGILTLVILVVFPEIVDAQRFSGSAARDLGRGTTSEAPAIPFRSVSGEIGAFLDISVESGRESEVEFCRLTLQLVLEDESVKLGSWRSALDRWQSFATPSEALAAAAALPGVGAAEIGAGSGIRRCETPVGLSEQEETTRVRTLMGRSGGSRGWMMEGVEEGLVAEALVVAGCLLLLDGESFVAHGDRIRELGGWARCTVQEMREPRILVGRWRLRFDSEGPPGDAHHRRP